MIEVSSLQKSFDEVEALKDVSFEANNGRITGLLGPNGAGKSTTLRTDGHFDVPSFFRLSGIPEICMDYIFV